MYPMPQVIRSGGHDLSCADFEEGEEGLVLKNEHGRNVGWLPYDEVERVLPGD